jgi:predicted dehydrogenase
MSLTRPFTSFPNGSSALSRNPIPVAIVGAGLMGRWHAHAAEKAGARVVGVVDVDMDAASRLSNRCSTAVPFVDIEQMLVRSNPAVVHICSPKTNHYSIAQTLISSGCHLLIEKPMTCTALETESLFESAAAYGVYVNPVHQFAFQDGVLKARRLLPRIGRLIDISAVVASAGGAGSPADQLDELAADVLPHPLSMIQLFLPGQLSGISWTTLSPAHGELRILGEVSGITLSVLVSFNARPSANYLVIRGMQGTIWVNLFHGYSFIESGAVSRHRKLVGPFMRSFKECASAASNLASRFIRNEPAYPGLQRLVRSFYDAVRTNVLPPISRSDSLEIAQVRDELVNTLDRVVERQRT